MERLTKRDADGQAMMDCQKCKADWTGKHGNPMADCTALYCRNRLLDRLAEYEDTGLIPEKVSWMKEVVEAAFDNDTSRIERAHNLHVADKEGRCVVLPCKVGDTVWRIKRTFETYPDKSKPYIEPDAFLLQDVFNIGKTVFLTREEAEKALAEMEDAK